MVFREGASSAGVVIAGVGPHLVGASASDGTVLWKRTIAGRKDRSALLIAFQHDRVIAGRDDELVCIDQRSGRIVWKAESPVAIATLIVPTLRRTSAAQQKLHWIPPMKPTRE